MDNGLTVIKIEKFLGGHELSTTERPYSGEEVTDLEKEYPSIEKIIRSSDSLNGCELDFIPIDGEHDSVLILAKQGLTQNRSYKVTLTSEPFAKGGTS